MPQEQITAQTAPPALPPALVEREERLAVVTLGPLLLLILAGYVARWCVRHRKNFPGA